MGQPVPRRSPGRECAAFGNLLILCLPCHGEVDDKKTGEEFYPVELLTRWKTAHEGSNGPAIATLGPVDEDTLTELLLSVFTPPVERLQQIADQLEETGTLTAGTVAQLRQVVDVLASTRADPSARTAAMLSHAADVFSTRAFQNTAASLSHAADIISATGGRSRRYGLQ